ncbi:Zinc finger protein bud20 [Ceratocystis fimbriata CBS 114723]|uniref:Zinc finger protein bud20 n=1 Tax=Ceratocystis fimbriata CBS 114723 TaxID=1035309 RepID=A0A2C5XMD5_9PEZI|nr:Zinc finger protein bud20 [Ceratocystis fimbriata CBS 114723]
MGGTFAKRTITKTRRKTRDLDQIKADMLSPKHLEQFKSSKAAEDLPGLGRHYCLECAKWFETEFSLIAHCKGKPHKRRVKALVEEAYTQREAEAAIGLRTDNKGPQPKPAHEDDVEMNS